MFVQSCAKIKIKQNILSHFFFQSELRDDRDTKGENGINEYFKYIYFFHYCPHLVISSDWMKQIDQS